MRTPTRLLLSLAIGAALVACTGPAPGSDDTSGGSSGPGGDDSAGLGAGPGISIDEAIDSTLDGPLLVNGYIVAEEGGEVRFCSALMESYPPQCGGSSLIVEGLNLEEVDALESAQGVSWTSADTQLLGTVEDGVLKVSTDSQG